MSGPSQPPRYAEAVRIAAEAHAANHYYKPPTAHPQQPYHMPYTAAQGPGMGMAPAGGQAPAFTYPPSQPLPPPGQGMNQQYIQMLQQQIQHLQMQMRHVQATGGAHPPAGQSPIHPQAVPEQQAAPSQPLYPQAGNGRVGVASGRGGGDMYGGFRMPGAVPVASLPQGVAVVYGTPTNSGPISNPRMPVSPPRSRPEPQGESRSQPVPLKSWLSQTTIEAPSSALGWDGLPLVSPRKAEVPAGALGWDGKPLASNGAASPSSRTPDAPPSALGWDGKPLSMSGTVAAPVSPPPRPVRTAVSPSRSARRPLSPPQSPKRVMVSPRRDNSAEGPTRAQDKPEGRPRSATEPAPPRPERRPSIGKMPAHIVSRPLPDPIQKQQQRASQQQQQRPTVQRRTSQERVQQRMSAHASVGHRMKANPSLPKEPPVLKRPPSMGGAGRPLPLPLKPSSPAAGKFPPSSTARALLSPRHSATPTRLEPRGDLGSSSSPPPVAPRQRSQTVAGTAAPGPPVISPSSRRLPSPPCQPLERRKTMAATKQLPGSLRDEIHKFQMEDYAKQFFRHHKKGHIFRRKIPFTEMLSWSKDPIPAALLSDLSDKHQKEAVEIFKCIQLFMQEGFDKKTGEEKKDKQKKTESTKSRMAQTILAKGLSVPELRDETYCQLCKQLTNNPSIRCVLRGWELFAITLEAFPPTKDLEPYIRWFLYATCKQPIVPGDSRKLPLFAAHCLRRYDAVWRAKGIVRMPTIAEIKRAKLAPFSTSMFGGDLHEMMEEQRRSDPSLLVPRVLLVICSNILESGGHLAEGIFRISANTTEMYELLIRLENKVAFLPPNPSPHIPAALLKCWISELLTSLVPHDCYDSLLAAKDDTGAIIRVVQERFPADNRNTLLFIIHFLRIIATFKAKNKMSERNLALIFSPNVFRCPYDEPRVQIFNTKVESSVLESIIVHMPIPREHQLLSVST